jgi:hypothetical protein
MEETTNATPAEIEEQLQDLTPLNIIRTETVLSRLPIHNLAKKGSINIQIIQKDKNGKVDLLWKVSPSRDYGEPRALAYKLDTIVINQRIDEQGRPLPKTLRLGSLRDVAQELELGSDTASARKALLQNASAFITAKLTYKANDGRVRRLETGFARYSVVFTGEELPDGGKADAVYLILNEPYREVLNNAPVRPLDYDYLRQLPPAGQRFYEILSRKIFAALKWKLATATLTYSEYCTYSAQRRYFERQPMQNQMSAIHREHKKFGYIASVKYTPTLDGENQPDWTMSYVPGPKAKAEYHAFTRSGRIMDIPLDQPTAAFGAPAAPGHRRAGPRQGRLLLAADPGEGATKIQPSLAEMIKRGISPRRAQALLAGSNAEQVLDLLEWGDYLIRQSRSGTFRNPPGFYIYLLAEKITPPENFETSRKRAIREEAARTEDRERLEQLRLEDAYNDYRDQAVTEYKEKLIPPDRLEAMLAEKVATLRQQYRGLPIETLRQFADRAVNADLRRLTPLMTFETFCERERQQPLETQAK